MGVGSLERCAVGMATLLGWRVIKKGALTERERKTVIEKRRCSTALISNFGLITAALYKSFEIPLFKQSAESCQCLFRANLWLPLQKASESSETQRQWESIRRLLARHTSLQQMGCAAFIGALVQSVAVQYSCLTKSKLDWPFYFGKVKKSPMLWACRWVSGWVSTSCTVSPWHCCFLNLSRRASLNWLYFLFWLNISSQCFFLL